MPKDLTISSFDSTPNPDAIKCVLSRPIEGPIRSFRAGKGEVQDPLARAILAIPGVQGVLIHPEWITISRLPDAAWGKLKAAVAKVVESDLDVAGDQAPHSSPRADR